jgi:hypothetical protein
MVADLKCDFEHRQLDYVRCPHDTLSVMTGLNFQTLLAFFRIPAAARVSSNHVHRLQMHGYATAIVIADSG